MSYSDLGGAAGLPNSLSLANGVYTYSATYNALVQPTDTKLTRVSDSTTLFEQKPTFDPVGNVSTVSTTLPAGTDQQAFCYDEQDRLTWASAASGAIPCGGTNTAGTLSVAGYTQTFAYDNLDRLTSGPLGSYSYGDSAHLHGATSIGGQWSGTYDAAGNLTCRAPSSATTCAGTPTGAQLSYDAEGRLSAWQNAPSSPTSTDSFLYDGAGHRVAQAVTSGGTTTTTTYVSNLEEVATTGMTSTATTYYYAGGKRIAEAVNGVLSYLGNDNLGSADIALSSTGTVQVSTLYAPYGLTRYSSGAMPGSYGFTGQRADGTTGLDYYSARYYDPVAGQFASADTVLDGLDRYAYVAGNPTSKSDPSGHVEEDGPEGELANLGRAGSAEGGDGPGEGAGEWTGDGPGAIAPQATADAIKYTVQNPDGTYTEVTENGQANTYDQNGQLRSIQDQSDFEKERFGAQQTPHDSQDQLDNAGEGAPDSQPDDTKCPSCSFKDGRRPGARMYNFKTDTTYGQAEQSLLDQGWQRSQVRDNVWMFTKVVDGKYYILRSEARSTGGWTLDVYLRAGGGIYMKIRLGDDMP